MSEENTRLLLADLEIELGLQDPKDKIISSLQKLNEDLTKMCTQKDLLIEYLKRRLFKKFGPVVGSNFSPEERAILVEKVKRLESENKILRRENGKLELDTVELKTLKTENTYLRRSFTKLSVDSRKEIIEYVSELKKISEMKKSLNLQVEAAEQKVKTEKEINKTLRLQLEVERDSVPPAKRSRVAIRREGGGPACVFFQNGEPQTGVWEGGGFVQTSGL